MTKANEHTTDYEEFYELWHKRVRTAVGKAGFFDPYQAEEMVQIIFTKFIVKDYLNTYDPERSAFSTFVWKMIQYTIMSERRALWEKGQAEFSADEYDPSTDEPIMLREDLAFVAKAKEEETIRWNSFHLHDALERTYNRLDSIPSRRIKFSTLLKSLVKQLEETGRINYATLAKENGISRQAVSQQVIAMADLPCMADFRYALVEIMRKD